MQRSKAAVSVEVKQVIGALCRLLAATGLEAVPAPEAFRRAKFGGGPGVEDQFWQLLANILQTAGIASCGERRELVSAGLWQTGYHADWMYGMEGGGGGGGGGGGEQGGRVSGRDLLLALGWLLAAGTLENLLSRRVRRLDKTLLIPPPVMAQLSSELQLDSSSLRRLQWLVGRLRHQGRILLSMQEERAHVLHAVSSVSLTPVSSSHQSSTVLIEECVRVRELCDLLEAYLNWKQVGKVFWTWMDSVVDSHLTDPDVKRPTHTPNGDARVCYHGNRGLEKFEEMLLSLPKRQRGQRRGQQVAEGGGGGRLQAGPDASSLLPLLSSLPSLPSVTQVYRARPEAERPVKPSSSNSSRSPAEGPCCGAGAPDELPASQAARRLLQTEALLLERRDKQRMANRMHLQDMIDRLDKVVLIPP